MVRTRGFWRGQCRCDGLDALGGGVAGTGQQVSICPYCFNCCCGNSILACFAGVAVGCGLFVVGDLVVVLAWVDLCLLSSEHPTSICQMQCSIQQWFCCLQCFATRQVLIYWWPCWAAVTAQLSLQVRVFSYILCLTALPALFLAPAFVYSCTTCFLCLSVYASSGGGQHGMQQKVTRTALHVSSVVNASTCFCLVVECFAVGGIRPSTML